MHGTTNIKLQLYLYTPLGPHGLFYGELYLQLLITTMVIGFDSRWGH